MVFPTGGQYEIKARGCNVAITKVGARLHNFIINSTEALATYGPDQALKGWEGAHLLPWPNRLRDGRYHLGDQEFRLPINESSQNNANHGLNVDLARECLTRLGTSARQRYVLWPRRGWSGILTVEILYQLETQDLRVEVTTTNIGTIPTPWGYGAHPYFRFEDISGIELMVPFDTELVVDSERLFSIRLGPIASMHDSIRARTIGEAVLGTTFTDPLIRDWTVILSRDGRTIEVWGEATAQWVQVFTAPHRDSMAVEPITCGPDAPNEGPTYRGRTILWSRESARTTWGIRATLRPVSQFGSA